VRTGYVLVYVLGGALGPHWWLIPMPTINGMWFQVAAEVSETWVCCLPLYSVAQQQVRHVHLARCLHVVFSAARRSTTYGVELISMLKCMQHKVIYEAFTAAFLLSSSRRDGCIMSVLREWRTWTMCSPAL
jgi:hypothetical protein